MITTAIVFDHRARTKRGEPGPLEVRVTIDRKSYYINTGVRILRAEYKYGVIINRPDSDELMERISIILRKVEHEINECLKMQKAINVAEVRRKVLHVDDSSMRYDDFMDWLSERVEMLKMKYKPNTIKSYNTLLKHLREYGKITRWDDLTVDAIIHFDLWLHQKPKPMTENQRKMNKVPEFISDAAVFKYHKTFKHLLNIAEKIDKINQNPYNKLQGEFSTGEKETVEYLTEEEMQAIQDAEIQRGSLLDMVRDLFTVQMYTGMAYADLMKFDINDYKYEDGKWKSNSERVKNGVAYVAHLLPPVVKVLEKYNMQLPTMTNQVYNRELKKLQQKAGIATRLHTHLARHTFATFMLANGVKVENLQRMMGHTDIKMTQRYAKTLAQSVHAEFDMIEKKLKKIK